MRTLKNPKQTPAGQNNPGQNRKRQIFGGHLSLTLGLPAATIAGATAIATILTLSPLPSETVKICPSDNPTAPCEYKLCQGMDARGGKNCETITPEEFEKEEKRIKSDNIKVWGAVVGVMTAMLIGFGIWLRPRKLPPTEEKKA